MLHSLLYFACLRNLNKQLACVSTEVDSRHIVLILMQQHYFILHMILRKKLYSFSVSIYFPLSSLWLTGWRCGALGSLQSAAGCWSRHDLYLQSIAPLSPCVSVSASMGRSCSTSAAMTHCPVEFSKFIHRYSQYLEKAPSSPLNTVSPPEIGKLLQLVN